MTLPDDAIPGDWIDALAARHQSRLTFSEVSRSVRALSSLYVERRGRRGGADPLAGAGKRAAFALFYAPLHFLLVRRIVRSLGVTDPAPQRVVDLGCGTGAAGAAWALEAGGRPAVRGLDRSAWAVEEARATYRFFRLRGTAHRRSVPGIPLGGHGTATVAAFLVNELEDRDRHRLLAAILRAAGRGGRILVVEPIARRIVPWWREWTEAFREAGGRADEWRFPARLPELLRKLDCAAGLDHSELTGRSLLLGRAGGTAV